MNHRLTKNSAYRHPKKSKTVGTKRSRRFRKAAWLSILACTIVVRTGCEHNGHLNLVLEKPEDAKLVPNLDQTSQVRLTAVGPNGRRQSIYGEWSSGSNSLDIGSIDPGPLEYLELVGFAADGHVLAYGRTIMDSLVETQNTTRSMALRRPITYVAGAGFILRIDTSQFDENQLLPFIQVTNVPETGTTQAVATTPDGRHVIAGATAPIVQTISVPTRGNPQPGDVVRSINWPGGVTLTDLAVSPDNRWLVVAATNANSGEIYRFSVENAIGHGINPNVTGPVYTFEGKPTKIRFTSMPDGSLAAVVLVDPADVKAVDCGQNNPASKYVLLPLDSTSYQPATLPFNGPVSDMETTRNPSIIYAVLPCDTNIGPAGLVGIDPQNGEVIRPAISISDARSVTKTSDFLVIGQSNSSQDKTFLQFMLQQIQGPWSQLGQVQIDMPPIDIQIGQAQSGTTLSLSVPAQTVVPYFIQGTPAGERISVLLKAIFASSPLQVDALSVPALTVEAYYYVTADLSAGQIGSTILTKCTITPSGSTNLNLSCVGNHPDASVGEFQPTDLAHIYEVP